MRTAIYIEDGVTQFILTPENEFEKATVKVLAEKPLSVEIFHGTFYDCRGGWTRQASHYPQPWYPKEREDSSIIVRITKREVDHDKASNGRSCT